MSSDLITKILSSYVIYPDWLCEIHIREIDELITSGEKSEAYELLTDLEAGVFYCVTCAELAGE